MHRIDRTATFAPRTRGSRFVAVKPSGHVAESRSERPKLHVEVAPIACWITPLVGRPWNGSLSSVAWGMIPSAPMDGIGGRTLMYHFSRRLFRIGWHSRRAVGRTRRDARAWHPAGFEHELEGRSLLAIV